MTVFSGAYPSTIELWQNEWEGHFLSTNQIDVGDQIAWEILTIRLPVLFHLAKLGAMVNTDEPTAELFRLAMIGLATENAAKAAKDV